MFSQRTRFNSQRTHGGSELPVTPVPGERLTLLISAGMRQTHGAQTSCRKNTHPHKTETKALPCTQSCKFCYSLQRWQVGEFIIKAQSDNSGADWARPLSRAEAGPCLWSAHRPDRRLGGYAVWQSCGKQAPPQKNSLLPHAPGMLLRTCTCYSLSAGL